METVTTNDNQQHPPRAKLELTTEERALKTTLDALAARQQAAVAQLTEQKPDPEEEVLAAIKHLFVEWLELHCQVEDYAGGRLTAEAKQSMADRCDELKEQLAGAADGDDKASDRIKTFLAKLTSWIEDTKMMIQSEPNSEQQPEA